MTTTTIQKTSKPIKAVNLLGKLLIVVGLGGYLSSSDTWQVFGEIALALGLALYAGSLWVKWWKHD